VDGLLLVKYNSRTNLSKGIKNSLPEYAKMFDTKIYKTHIREAVAVREAQAAQESLFSWAPGSKPAEDYETLLNEILGG
jgi:chromosome partitioning protein